MESLGLYVINLARASHRWRHMQEIAQRAGMVPFRIEAIDGTTLTLPHHSFDEEGFKKNHGREINILEVACYLSHLKALETFLKSSFSYALIAEDDLEDLSDLPPLLKKLESSSSLWNLVRLSGLKEGDILPLLNLSEKYQLGVRFGRLKGAGLYLVDKKAAQALVEKATPMRVPWDHAFDREWKYGFKTLVVDPFPLVQAHENLPSQIQYAATKKLSSSWRWRHTYPYQIVNETERFFYRSFLWIILKIRSLNKK